jgi:hypothetical protein
LVVSSRLDYLTARLLLLEEFKNELLKLARVKLGDPSLVGSTRVDPDAYKTYIQQILNTLASSAAK